LGVNTPTSPTRGRGPVDITSILSRGLISPCMTRNERHDAEIVVEPRVDDQRLQAVGIARLGRRDARDDRFEHVGHVLAVLALIEIACSASMPMTASIFLLDLFGVGRAQVDLVEDRHDFQGPSRPAV
jgi:hypothetical protein